MDKLLFLLLGLCAVGGFVWARRQRRAADARIEAKFAQSVRRAQLGIPALTISEIYDQERY